MADNTSQSQGFALLVSLIVVSVVLSVGLVILDLTIKQVRLAAASTDSELSFHAANAGIECARYWRRELSDVIVGNEFAVPPIASGEPMLGVNCFMTTGSPYDIADSGAVVLSSGSVGSAHQYLQQFDWPSGDRCSEINMVVAVASLFDSAGDPGFQVEVTNMQDLISNYPASSLVCSTGSQCTVISVKGYNRPCSQINNFGTVQREVLLEF